MRRVYRGLSPRCHLSIGGAPRSTGSGDALKLDEIEDDTTPGGGEAGVQPLPQLARMRIDTQRCLPYLGPECGACADSCPVEGAMSWSSEKPFIDEQLCTGCALCREACVLEPGAIEIEVLV